jgi:hypothetical protein
VDDETIGRELFLRFYGTDVPERLRSIVLKGWRQSTVDVDIKMVADRDEVYRTHSPMKGPVFCCPHCSVEAHFKPAQQGLTS